MHPLPLILFDIGQKAFDPPSCLHSPSLANQPRFKNVYKQISYIALLVNFTVQQMDNLGDTLNTKQPPHIKA